MEAQRSPQPQTGSRHHHRSHTLEQAEGVSTPKRNGKEKEEKEGEKKEVTSPWTRDKPREIARSLGVPIGWRRRSESEGPARDDNSDNDENNNNNNNDSNNTSPVCNEKCKYVSAHPRAGVEMLCSGLGVNLPLSATHHRALSNDSSPSPSSSFSSPSSSTTTSPHHPTHQRAHSDDTSSPASFSTDSPQSNVSTSSSSSATPSHKAPPSHSHSSGELVSSQTPDN